MKFSKARHGTITYRMAVINEFGLLCLAWSLAAFNVMSVWNSGNRLQGFILGICWFAVGVMELSIIPLAGSLRIARWWDKPLALLGVASLMGLTAFTVYEFNEFASYYLTKPGRDAVIQLSNLRQQAENLRANIDQATKRQATGVSELNRLTADEQGQLSSLEKDFQSRMSSMQAAHETQLKGLQATLPELKVMDAATTELIRPLQEKIQRVETDRDAQIAQIRTSVTQGHTAVAGAADSRRKDLEAQRSDAQNQIAELRKAMMTEVEAVTGAFKQTKKNAIRDRYQAQIEQQQTQINQVNADIRKLTAPAPLLDPPEIQRVREKAAAEIATVERQIESIRTEAAQKVRTQQQQHGQETSRVRSELARLETAHQTNAAAHRSKYEAAREKLVRFFAERRQSLGQASLTEADLQKLVATNQAKVEALETECVALEAQTERRMEPVLYYRIAKWFHHGPGIPTKEDYLRAQIYIFAPAGLFLSLISIALAFVGTGLRNDDVPEDVLQQRLRDAERDGRNKEQARQEAERRLRDTEVASEKFRAETEKRIRKALDDALQHKIDMAEVLPRIPQTIIVGRVVGQDSAGSASQLLPTNHIGNGSTVTWGWSHPPLPALGESAPELAKA